MMILENETMRPTRRITCVMKAKALGSFVCLAVFLIGSFAGAQEKRWKAPAEKDLFNAALKSPDATQRLRILGEWKQQYPSTEFENERLALHLMAYMSLQDSSAFESTARQFVTHDSNQGVYYVAMLAPALLSPSSGLLALGESSATALLLQVALANKPDGASEHEWLARKNDLEGTAHRLLGWSRLHQGRFQEAEAALVKSLELAPAETQTSMLLTRALLKQDDDSRYWEAFYHLVRLVALTAQSEDGSLNALRERYAVTHGSTDGWEALVTMARVNPMPPPHFRVKTAQEIGLENARASSPTPTAECESRFVQGVPYALCVSSELELWLSVSRKGKYLEASVYVLSLADKLVTVDATGLEITAVATRSATRLKTFTPDEYLKKVQPGRLRRGLAEFLVRFSESGPTATTSGTMKGTYQGTRDSGTYRGSYEGTVTDHAAANRRAQARIDAMNANAAASIEAVSEQLLRKHTLVPNVRHGGMIYVEWKKADWYRAAFRAGEQLHEFTFSLDENGTWVPRL